MNNPMTYEEFQEKVPLLQVGDNAAGVLFHQFSEDKLYIMTVVLDSDKIDYYSMYQSLSKKYGEPDSLSPRKALWNSDTVRLSLEKPLSVKYIDSVIYDSLLKESQAGIDYEELLQESFIESF